MTKPFDRDFLIDRVAAALRRVVINNRSSSLSPYQDDYLTIDPIHRQVAIRGEPVQLSYTEFRLLSYLIRHADKERTYNQILKYVWGEIAVNNSFYVHSYIWRLRKKLEEDPASPTYLVSGQTNSYRFVKR
ncbi:MAG TPA: hypothetical protein DEP47_11185 [Chloroflexi bacterium]|nr:hypothetical protein [Chloroflexota bacterium]